MAQEAQFVTMDGAPGRAMDVSCSMDVLGVLIMRVSGKSLSTFMRERIFDPLGMKDTAFSSAFGD